LSSGWPERLEALQGRLGHRFLDVSLLEQALTHKSYLKEASRAGRSNEPLEFLGDAILGFVVADLLHQRSPTGAEGGKTRARAALVSAVNLSRHAEALGLPDALRFGKGEEKAGGRRRPSLWGNAYEAIVAALYLDGGLGSARRFVESDMQADLARSPWLTRRDAKSELQELLQGRGEPLPEYVVIREAAPGVASGFVVECRLRGVAVSLGRGPQKKAAQQDAASRALERLTR
jgi:ribonuclease-3